MQRSFEGFVCFLGSNGRLALPYFLGLPTDVVDLLLHAETMISKFCAVEEEMGEELSGKLTSVKQGPGVVMRNPSSPCRCCERRLSHRE